MTTRPLTDIISIVVTRQTTTVSRFGFGYALMLAEHQRSLNRVETISKGSWATTLTGLGFTSSDAAYVAFSDYFAQTPSPNYGYIGRVNAEEQNIQITAYDVGTTYQIDLTSAGGTKAYTSLAAGSADLAAAELAGKIQADAATYFVAATAPGDTVLCVATPVGSAYTVTGSVSGASGGTIGATTVSTWEDPDDALTANMSASNDWYTIIGVGAMGRTLGAQKLIADWVESQKRLYLVASADDNVRDLTVGADTSTSIAGYLKESTAKNSGCIFHGSAATQYLDAAWAGRCLPANPGSINWWYKQLSSVTVDSDHTPTRRTNMGDKGCSWFESLGGLNMVQGGYQKAQLGYGDFIDVTRIAHWAEQRTMEEMVGVLARVDQVPYTQEGADVMGAALESVFLEGVANKALASYTMSVPVVADIATSYKTMRHLPDVSGVGIITGKINSVGVALTIAV